MTNEGATTMTVRPEITITLPLGEAVALMEALRYRYDLTDEIRALESVHDDTRRLRPSSLAALERVSKAFIANRRAAEAEIQPDDGRSVDELLEDLHGLRLLNQQRDSIGYYQANRRNFA